MKTPKLASVHLAIVAGFLTARVILAVIFCLVVGNPASLWKMVTAGNPVSVVLSIVAVILMIVDVGCLYVMCLVAKDLHPWSDYYDRFQPDEFNEEFTVPRTFFIGAFVPLLVLWAYLTCE